MKPFYPPLHGMEFPVQRYWTIDVQAGAFGLIVRM
jgi:hypothetical protein